MTGWRTVLAVAIAVPCALISRNADADHAALKQPTLGGNGCPQGSYSVSMSPDKHYMTLLFDSYEIEGEQEKKSENAACTISVPIEVPDDRRITLIDVDYRGYAFLPPGTEGKFSCEYTMDGTPNESGSMTFAGGFDDDFSAGHTFDGPQAGVKFPCGKDVTFKVLTRLESTKLGPKPVWINMDEQPYATVDSADYAVSVLLETEHCDDDQHGSWYPAKMKECSKFCDKKGMDNVPSPDGAYCASGENKPASALAAGIDFLFGCWPNCSAGLRGPAPKSKGPFCYAQGQKKDNDKTDRTVACFCSDDSGGGGGGGGISEPEWYQAKMKSCPQFCDKMGLENVPSVDGAYCASGENTPASAVAAGIDFMFGCWPNGCFPGSHGPTPKSKGPFCYSKGQKKDADKTDRTVACSCG